VGYRRVAWSVALVLLTGTPSSGALVRTLQTGTAQSTANGTLTVTIASVDTTKTVLFFDSRHNSNRPVGSVLRGKLASATTLEFVRVTDEVSPATIDIQWYVVEYATGVAVQRGETAQSGTTTNVTITAVAAVNQAFVLWSKTPASANSAWDTDDPILGELTTTTNLQFRTNQANAAHTIAWQVVEYPSATDITVQKGSTSMTGTTTSVTATLSPAVNTAQTFVLAGLRSSGTGSDIGGRMIRARLTNSTTVTIDRSISGTPSVSRVGAWGTGLTYSAGAGSNRLLVFALGYEAGADPGVSGVTWGGRSLTRITGDVAGTTIFGRVELWYLKETDIAAASGTTFVVTWGGTAPTDVLYAAATYRDVEQATPIATSNTASSDAGTPNPITAAVSVAARNTSVAVVVAGETGSYGWNNSWTEGTDQAVATVTVSTGDHDETSAGTATASATHTAPNRQAIAVAVLNPDFQDDMDEIVWQAIELKDGSVVQGGNVSFSSGTAQASAALSPAVDLSASVAFASGQGGGGLNMGRSPYTGDDLPGVASATTTLSATTITLDRASTVDSADIGWFVVQFRPRRLFLVE
jgi:hypothetical protein